MKEMVGGCCVCSDERGWAENPLVYCDGQGCTVAVHQACYGIVTVPTGPWFCRKCESQERAARVRCELCPSRDGALKRTDNNGWAHVVCALYIPEVRFGNVTTMEPIILQLIPTERFSKVCYICEEQGKGSRAMIGACMQCNKSGCKQQFHVTCAQALGLLCEEAGNYLDNVKYCGYCQHHYSKLKKGGNVKTIPPYKPIPADNGSSDSSPEKESESVMKQGFGGKRKSGGKSNLVGGKSVGKVGGHSPAAGDSSSVSPDVMGESSKGPSPSFGKDLAGTGGSNVTNAVAGNSKFSTSNFIESVMTQAASLQPSVQVLPPAAVVTTASPAYQQTSVVAASGANGAVPVPVATTVAAPASAAVPSSTVPVVPSTSVEPVSGNRPAGVGQEELPPPGKRARSQSTEKNDKGRNKKRGSAGVNNIPSTIITSTATTTITTTATATTTITTATTVSTSTVTLTSSSATISTVSSVSNTTAITTTTATTLTAIASATATSSLTQVTAVNCGNKRGSRASHGNSNTPPPLPVHLPPSSVGPSLQSPMVKESPPSSPNSETTSVHSGSRRSKSKKSCSREKEERDLKLFQNGVSAPHMLGNQLNPSSTMAQKMSDTLSQELEAHSIFNDSSNSTSNLVGPPLHSRVIASVRSGQNNSSSSTSASSSAAAANAASASASTSVATIPQSLDQLLERQWEQGSQFLMEQAQHFDRFAKIVVEFISSDDEFKKSHYTPNASSIHFEFERLAPKIEELGVDSMMGIIPMMILKKIASLLSCLHQLRAENLRLEEHVNSLLQRRDHLLAVNARLAIPLTSQPPAQVNNVHPSAGAAPHHQEPPRATRVNNSYLPHPMENGLPPEPSPPAGNLAYPHQHRSPLAANASPAERNIPPQPSSSMRPSPASGGYMMSQSPLNPPAPQPPPAPGSAASTPGVVRSTSGTPESMRSGDGRRSGSYPVYPVASQNVSQVPVVTTQQMVRRDAMSDLHLKMPSSKPG
ncbi:PHD finger protein rhinoceros [Gryllus bimaculatus]|nr:PHD finger protein rhinoceros [Gryllus bimaculatus]